MPVEPDPTSPKGGFRWPPRQPQAVAPLAIRRSPVQTPLPARPVGGWAAFEDDFLGRTAGPLKERAARAGWTPDAPGTYCDRCGRALADRELTTDGCSECAGVRFAWDRLVRLGEYSGLLRRWIHEVKFTRWRRLGTDLGVLLGEALSAAQEAAPDANGIPPVIVPVPDAALRRLWRGIDHAAVIAGGAARATGWPLAQPLARRFGRSQLAVPPSERAANVARAFELRRTLPADFRAARRIIVVDDVVTTGATMRTCCRLVRRAGVGSAASGTTPREVWAACLARTELADGRSARPRTPSGKRN